MDHVAEIYFGLFGVDFDPESLDIGIAPTQTRKKAEPFPKRSMWIYSSGKVSSRLVDVYDMAVRLVAALQPHTEAIVLAKRQHHLEAVLQVVLTIADDDELSMPAIGFDVPVIDFLHAVGGSIDVDTYRGES